MAVRILSYVFVLISMFLLVGCGESVSPANKVTGVVTVGGKPIEGATVIFEPSEGRSATGITDAKGEFTLTTHEEGDGAVEGTHKVAISKAAYVPKDTSLEELAKAEKSKSPVPEKFGSTERSELTAKVTADGKNHFEFKLSTD